MTKSSSRLIQLIQSLQEKEKKQFTLFISSPYFNTNKRLVKLWKYLAKLQWETASIKLDKKALFQKIYGTDHGFNQQQIYDHFSFLLRLLENFLAQQDFEQDHSAKQKHLLAALTPRNQVVHFERVYRKSQKRWLNHPFRDNKYYIDRFLQAKEGAEFSGQLQKRTNDDYLTQTIEFLDISYFASRLKFTCESINRENILQTEFSNESPQWILDGVPKAFQKIPVITIYYQIFLTLHDAENESHYHGLVDLLKQHADLFPKKELSAMYTYAQNYCIKMINRGNSAYEAHLFDLFQDLLEKEVLIENGKIDHRKYKNIITVGLRMNAFDWVKKFLNNYREFLPETYRENAYNYNLASFYYEQKNYREALQLLNQVSFADVYYHLSSRSMVLKIYFEMEEENALDSLLDTFRIYLDRNKTISIYQRTVHKNLIKFTRKLSRLRNQLGILSREEFESRLMKLELQVTDGQEIANINWLKEKIEEVKKNDSI